jgi:RNase P subunit RPR2
MRKCSCGKPVSNGDEGAVRVYDRRRKLVRVICSTCATRGVSPKKRGLTRKKGTWAYSGRGEDPSIP